jgi:hypothetical protein
VAKLQYFIGRTYALLPHFKNSQQTCKISLPHLDKFALLETVAKLQYFIGRTYALLPHFKNSQQTCKISLPHLDKFALLEMPPKWR